MASQSIPTRESLVGDLLTLVPNVVHHELAKSMKVPGDVLVYENSRNDKLERVK